jgi:ribosomal protein L29
LLCRDNWGMRTQTVSELREEIKALRKENRELRSQLDQIGEIVSPDEEDYDDDSDDEE